MKKNLLRLLIILISIFSFLILYLSTFVLEKKKFNRQIEKKILESSKNFEVELKEIRLILNPFNFTVNAKTIAPKIFYKKNILQLEYIQAQISLLSLTKNQIISSKLKISTRSIPFKDLIAFARVSSNKPELYILERSIKKGQIILDIDLNFDETGKIKSDYEIKAILKDGKIKLFKNFYFENIKFLLKINYNIFYF